MVTVFYLFCEQANKDEGIHPLIHLIIDKMEFFDENRAIEEYYENIAMHEGAVNVVTNYTTVTIRANTILKNIDKIHDYLLSGVEDIDHYRINSHALCARVIKTTCAALRTQEFISETDTEYFCEEFERIRQLLFRFYCMKLTNDDQIKNALDIYRNLTKCLNSICLKCVGQVEEN